MKTVFWKFFVILNCDFASKKSFVFLEILEMWKKTKTKSPQFLVKKNNICQNSQYRSVREIGTLARVLSWKVWLKNVILVRKRFLMVPQLESISWCLFQKFREEIGFRVCGLKRSLRSCLSAKKHLFVFPDPGVRVRVRCGAGCGVRVRFTCG